MWGLIGLYIRVERSADMLADSTVRGWLGLGPNLRVGQVQPINRILSFARGPVREVREWSVFVPYIRVERSAGMLVDGCDAAWVGLGLALRAGPRAAPCTPTSLLSVSSHLYSVSFPIF